MGLKKETITALREQLDCSMQSLHPLLVALENQLPDGEEATTYAANYFPGVVADTGKLLERAGKFVAELGTCKMLYDPPAEEIG